MSTITAKERAVEYAKNFPTAVESGLYGPVAISNIVAHNGRVISNLCLKTTTSGQSNTSISFPHDWPKASRFKSGELVNVQVEQGRIRNIWHARPIALVSGKPASDATVVEQSSSDQVVEEATVSADGNTPF